MNEYMFDPTVVEVEHAGASVLALVKTDSPVIFHREMPVVAKLTFNLCKASAASAQRRVEHGPCAFDHLADFLTK